MEPLSLLSNEVGLFCIGLGLLLEAAVCNNPDPGPGSTSGDLEVMLTLLGFFLVAVGSAVVAQVRWEGLAWIAGFFAGPFLNGLLYRLFFWIKRRGSKPDLEHQ